MQKLIFILAFFLVCCQGAASQAGNRLPHKKGVATGQKPPQIGTIKKMLADGCGCSLQSPSDHQKHNQRFLFLSDFGDIVQMNIDDVDRRLKLANSTKGKGKPVVGNRHSETYISGETKVKIDWTVSEVCDPQDESCEVTWYSAVITVNRSGRIGKVTARGMCGC
jgi:hypothetical protein